MNVAVDLDYQRLGVASALLAELYAQVGDDDARFTLEVRRSNDVAIHLYEREGFRAAGMRRRYYQDNGEDAIVMWRTPATLRARSTTCPTRGGGPVSNILALESSCDDTCAAVLGADGRLRSNVISSQGVHDRFGGVVPEIASRQHLELINLVVEQALSEADMTLEQIDLVAATQGPGLVGALLVGFPPERLWPRPVSCRSRPSITCRGTSRRTSSVASSRPSSA